jgi:hypothetical protein
MPTNKTTRNDLANQIRQMLGLSLAPPKKGEVKATWLQLTEETNALDYLDKAVLYIRETQTTPTAWKWVILGLHGALYGFAICALKGTNPERVADFRSRHKSSVSLKALPNALGEEGFPRGVAIKYRPDREQIDFTGTMSLNDCEMLLGLSEEEKYQKAIKTLFAQSQRLISFPEAIKRCQDPRYMQMTIMSKWLEPTADQTEAIEKLHGLFRNSFLHYKPMAWSIELHGQPNLSMHILDIIRFLALNTGNYVHLASSQRRKVKSLVSQAKRILKQSPLYLRPEEAD